MKTKIGLPFGLALVVFIGVFTAMLALGLLSPERADALAETVKLTLSESVAGATPQTVTIEFTNDDEQIDGGTAIPITLTSLNGSDAAVGKAEDDTSSNWMFYINDVMVPQEGVIVTGGAGTVDITLPDDDAATDGVDETVNIPAAAKVKFMFTSDDSGSAPAGFVLGTAGTDAMVQINSFDSNGYTLTDGSGSVMNLRVTSSSMTPGARARYTFRFQINDQPLVANQDEITLYFDKDFGGLDELSRNDVTVSSIATADDADATGAFSPSSDPSRQVLTVTKHGIIAKDSLNNVEYTFRAPDMNGGNSSE